MRRHAHSPRPCWRCGCPVPPVALVAVHVPASARSGVLLSADRVVWLRGLCAASVRAGPGSPVRLVTREGR